MFLPDSYQEVRLCNTAIVKEGRTWHRKGRRNQCNKSMKMNPNDNERWLPVQKQVPFSSPCSAACMQLLANYKPQDLILTKSQSHASLLWGTNPSNRAAMVRELANATCIYSTISVSITTCIYIIISISTTMSMCTIQKKPGIIQSTALSEPPAARGSHQ